jgi:hypothetical protein
MGGVAVNVGTVFGSGAVVKGDGSVDCVRACLIAPERVDEVRWRLTGLHLASSTRSSISLPTT